MRVHRAVALCATPYIATTIYANSAAELLPRNSASIVSSLPFSAPTCGSNTISELLLLGAYDVTSASANFQPFSISHNSTATMASSEALAAEPQATTTQPAEAAGRTVPSEMKTSMFGLLGFCIMALVML